MKGVSLLMTQFNTKNMKYCNDYNRFNVLKYLLSVKIEMGFMNVFPRKVAAYGKI